MNILYNTYNNACNGAQSYIEARINDVPKDFIKSSVKSFGYSFASSILLGGGLKSGLTGGLLGILATTTYAVFMTAVEKLNRALSNYFNKPHRPIDTEARHYAAMVALAVPLCLGRAIKMPINPKASFFLTIPFYMWNTFKNEGTPLTGFVVV